MLFDLRDAGLSLSPWGKTFYFFGWREHAYWVGSLYQIRDCDRGSSLAQLEQSWPSWLESAKQEASHGPEFCDSSNSATYSTELIRLSNVMPLTHE